MIEHVLRLLPGQDLLQTVSDYCKKYNIEGAYIGTGVGSLAKINFRKGDTRKRLILEGSYEIVSMVGTVSKSGEHIHASISDEDFNVLGGHLDRGCIVKSTAEIVLIELEKYELTRSKDIMTGYKSLIVITTNNAKSNN